MSNKLPFLVSIPHGGNQIPVEVENDLILSEADLLADSDAFTQDLYNVSDMVETMHVSPVFRAVIDVNRAPDQFPPEFQDGLMKTRTCLGLTTYKDHLPSPEIQTILKEKYYDSFHSALKQKLQNRKVLLGLDCHSMLTKFPESSRYSGTMRPLINLGNRDGSTCTDSLINSLRTAFETVFDISREQISLNKPFKGGFITSHYGNNPLPWIQIEMRRDLYLDDELFLTSTKPDFKKILKINRQFRNVLLLFAKEI